MTEMANICRKLAIYDIPGVRADIKVHCHPDSDGGGWGGASSRHPEPGYLRWPSAQDHPRLTRSREGTKELAPIR